MSKKITPVYNQQGFYIIVMPGIAQHALFNKNQCDLCGELTGNEADVYYESVLDSFYCERCHGLYIQTAIRYKVEERQEIQNFNKIKKQLEGVKWWNVKLI